MAQLRHLGGDRVWHRQVERTLDGAIELHDPVVEREALLDQHSKAQRQLGEILDMSGVTQWGAT